jgi:4-deoxy-L-threo-5-hexosulose-uronate ketol-isomerase
VPGSVELIYWETDRTVLGGIVPLEEPLALPADPVLAATTFCERRELAAFNLGGAGEVAVDGKHFPLATRDGIYIGRGSRDISFSSGTVEHPARFFIISYPAHCAHPTSLIPQSAANRVELGAAATANQRTIFQYIHEAGALSCQLVAGMTELKTGNIWNTMPPHTHARRSEVYFYFDLPENAAVIHLMGPAQETRHLVVQNMQAILSPIWSVHAGCGTEAYRFIWAMGGENQLFSDMAGIPVNELK